MNNDWQYVLSLTIYGFVSHKSINPYLPFKKVIFIAQSCQLLANSVSLAVQLLRCRIHAMKIGADLSPI
jgi:hypothetical protein